MIDEKGRLFGKISVIDIVIVIAVLIIGIGFAYNRTSAHVRQIIRPDTPLSVTFLAEGVREFTLDAISEGDVIFRQHERVPLGTVTHIETAPAYDIIVRPDGTAALAQVEGRYNMYITLDAVGSVSERGFFVNGTLQLAPGMRLSIQFHNLLTMVMVHEIFEN